MIEAVEGNALPAGLSMKRATGSCLRAAGLVKSFRGRKVVKGVSVEVHAGEVVGLLGPNEIGRVHV